MPINKTAINQVQNILREQFPLIGHDDIDKLPDKLKNPLKFRFRSILFVADDMKKGLQGFALLMHAPDLDFCYLDFISAAKEMTGRGIGGALYERVRKESLNLKCKALFFECLPDDSALCRDPEILKQNKARLRFYEKYGATPLINTAYETPVKANDDNPPYLVIDPLDNEYTLNGQQTRLIIQAILERKYPDVCSREYIKKVIDSVKDGPVSLRKNIYIKKTDDVRKLHKEIPDDQLIALFTNKHHKIHHIKERGYVESPVRVENIKKAVTDTGFFQESEAMHFPDKLLNQVHDNDYVNYLRTVCTSVPDGESVYPYVFPIRNPSRRPKDLPMRAGYYCIDTFTPLNKNAFTAAREAVDCALSAAKSILEGRYLAYALIRPPGHHAEKNVFGGFCYFNSNAIAAEYLSQHGSVAILDIDYHHGNGQQQIFYERSDVLTVSIHGHPRFAYPFFSGFTEECGNGQGKGYNLNFPLPEDITPEKYIDTVQKAIHRIQRFNPQFLVVALGLDTAKGDPTGTWTLTGEDFKKIGVMIGDLPYSTVFIQEGGYHTKTIGKNARMFFTGVWQGSFT